MDYPAAVNLYFIIQLIFDVSSIDLPFIIFLTDRQFAYLLTKHKPDQDYLISSFQN